MPPANATITRKGVFTSALDGGRVRGMRIGLASLLFTLSLAAFGAGLEVMGITDPETGRALLGLAAILAITSVVIFIWPVLQTHVRSNFIVTWRYRPEDRDWVPFRRVILLEEAARFSYEKLRGRSVSVQKLPARAADMKFEGEAKPLSWFGHAILGRGDIPVFGSHPPSTKMEIVPKKMTEASGALSDDANSIHYYGEKTPEYISLTIKRADFWRRLKEIKGWHGDDS